MLHTRAAMRIACGPQSRDQAYGWFQLFDKAMRR